MLAHTSPVVFYAAAAIAGAAMLFLAFHTSYALVAVLLTCLVMLLFAVYLAQWVMAKDEGTVDMQEVHRLPLQALGCQLRGAQSTACMGQVSLCVSSCCLQRLRVQQQEELFNEAGSGRQWGVGVCRCLRPSGRVQRVSSQPRCLNDAQAISSGLPGQNACAEAVSNSLMKLHVMLDLCTTWTFWLERCAHPLGASEQN